MAPNRARSIGTLSALLVAALGMLLTSACALPGSARASFPAPSTPAPVAWQMQWLPQSAGTAPGQQAAKAAAASQLFAQPPGRALQAPTRLDWLMQGPAMALALAQLDPAGQQMGMVVLTRDAQTGQWRIGGSTTAVRPAADAVPQNSPAARIHVHSSTGTSLGFLADTYVGSDFEYTVAPAYHVQVWMGPTQPGHVFVMARFPGDVAEPGAESQPVTVGGHTGWQSTQDGVAAIVVPLGQQTLVLGGRATLAQMRQIATRAATHPNANFHP